MIYSDMNKEECTMMDICAHRFTDIKSKFGCKQYLGIVRWWSVSVLPIAQLFAEIFGNQ